VARIEDALRVPGIIIDHAYLQQLAFNYDTTIRTIYRHKARVELNCPVAQRSGGPRPIISWRIQQAMKMLLDQRPWYYQGEICQFLHEAFDIDVVRSTISRVLKRIRITRKKLKDEAA
jgi:transposase